MNILLNFFPVKSGGGQQVASNFLNLISRDNYNHNWFVYVGENSELHEIAKRNLPESNILSTKYSYKARIFNHKMINSFIGKHNIQLIYNYAPVLKTKKKIPQVVRSVYSNLYFPEINFWEGYSPLIKIKKKIIDLFRLHNTLKADGLIFENKGMQRRATEMYNFPFNKTKYIEPSVSDFDDSLISQNFLFLNNIKEFKILYLTSWHMNKNIHILPKVAKELKIKNIKLKFVLSLHREDANIQKKMINVINELQVSDYFIFAGKVASIYVHQVIKSCDSMILLSKLECFSSNIVEAFFFQRSLIISNEMWSKTVCEDAVLYVQRDDVKDIANKIENLVRNERLRKELILKGHNRLAQFNTPEEKVIKQIRFLEKIFNRYSV